MIKFNGVPMLALGLAMRQARGFAGGGWKLNDAKDAILLKDGNPIYVDENGAEKTVDIGTISRLNGEAKSHRERAEAAEAANKAFEGLDPKKAREAIETLGKIDLTKMVDSGKLDEVRAEITKGFTAQVETEKSRADGLQSRLNNMLLGQAFGASKFITDKMAIPADIVQRMFAENFAVEGDKIVAKGPNGQAVYSKTRVGEAATFDEALEQFVDGYSNKDAIMKASGSRGSGNGGGGGNDGSGKARYTRAEFDKMTPTDQAKVSVTMREGKAELVD